MTRPSLEKESPRLFQAHLMDSTMSWRRRIVSPCCRGAREVLGPRPPPMTHCGGLRRPGTLEATFQMSDKTRLRCGCHPHHTRCNWSYCVSQISNGEQATSRP